MAYQAPNRRSPPTAFLFLVDQSGAMGDRMAGSEKTKARFVSDVLNRTFVDLVSRCTNADGVRDYFDIGVIGYGGDGVNNGMAFSAASSACTELFSPSKGAAACATISSSGWRGKFGQWHWLRSIG